MTTPTARHRRGVLLALQGAISAGLLAFLAFRIEWTALAGAAKTLSWGWAVATGLSLLAADVLNAWRWQRLATFLRVPLPFGFALRIHYVGMYLNLFLPGTLGGDAWRMWKASALSGGLGGAASAVFAERLMLLVGLLLLVAATLPWMPTVGGNGDVLIGALAGAALLSAGALVSVALLPRLVTAMPDGLRRSRLVKGAADVALVLPRLARPAVAAEGLLTAILSHCVIILAIYCAIRAAGAEVLVFDAVILLPPVLLLVMLPISVAGWGVRETGLVFVMSIAGVPAEQALLGSLLVGAAMMAVHLPAAAEIALGRTRR